MKKILWALFTAVVAMAATTTSAADTPNISRNQLLKLYHNGYKAVAENNIQGAVDNFGAIISSVPQLPEPYLALAQIFEKNKDVSRDYLEGAVLFYRKYVDTQLDDTKTAEAFVRLRALENELQYSHYEDTINAQEAATAQEYAAIEHEIAQEVKAEEAAVQPVVAEELAQVGTSETLKPEVVQTPEPVKPQPKQEVAETTPEKMPETATQPTQPVAQPTQPIAQREQPSQPAQPVAQPLQPVAQSKEKELRPLLTPIVPEARRSVGSITSAEKIDPGKLVGRWVSTSRMHDGREVWIIDITIAQGELRVEINPNSGIFQMPQWQQGAMDERETLMALANSKESVTLGNDVTAGTMQMMNYLKSKVASAQIADQSRLVFNYKIDLLYRMTQGKRDGRRMLGGLFGTLAGSFGGSGFLGDMASTLMNTTNDLIQRKADYDDAADTDMKYVAEVNFDLKATPSGLLGTGREVVIELSDKGQHETKNQVFNTRFIPVSSNYTGYKGDGNEEKMSSQMDREKKSISQVQSLAKTDAEKGYLLGLMYNSGVGDKNGRVDDLKVHKQMRKAADKGSVRAAEFIINDCFDKALSNKSNKSVRKKNLELADKYCTKFAQVAPAMVNKAKAEYAVKSECDYDKAAQLLLGPARQGDVDALNRLGEIYIYNLDNSAAGIDCIAQAARGRNADAMLNIAILYRDGRGVNQNVEEYIDWLCKAYENGSTKAAYELSRAYAIGLGVTPDVNISNRYFKDFMHRVENEWEEVYNHEI